MSRFRTILLALLLSTGCIATPLPLPPSMDASQVGLKARGLDQVSFVGSAGAVDEPNVRLLVTNVERDLSVELVVDESGGFRVGLAGRPTDTFRFSGLAGERWEPMLECTTDGEGGVHDLGLGPGPGGPTDRDADGVEPPADCDDTDPATGPGQPDLCDGVDNDCDGLVDDGCVPACSSDADCDDGDPTTDDTCDRGVCTHVPPTCTPEPEICDGLDNDCDGLIDEDCESGECSADEDCEDGDPTTADRCEVSTCVHDPPGCEAESCDGLDNDCDGSIDELCLTCASADDCDDGLYCNGAEVCSDGICTSGSAIECEGGDPTAPDHCSEAEDRCVST